MALFVGLDVSLRTISVCIVEAKGKVVWEGKVLCEGPALIAALAPYRKKIKSVGIEAGPLSEWLFGILTECHFNAVCIEARHAHRFLSSRPNKTDRNDARGIADMMRLGHFKAVHVKSRASQLPRAGEHAGTRRYRGGCARHWGGRECAALGGRPLGHRGTRRQGAERPPRSRAATRDGLAWPSAQDRRKQPSPHLSAPAWRARKRVRTRPAARR
jgi:hypothetical protein